MGLFDSFVLTTPMQCPVCCTGSEKTFQTKSIRCVLDCFYEGKPAVTYGWEEMTEREYLNAVQMHRLLYGDLFLPVFSKDSTKISFRLADGIYPAYHYCHQCKEYYYINAIVKNGIFTGIIEKRGMEVRGDEYMSDGITDAARAEQEKLEYFCAVNTIAKYIADRAYKRPLQIREQYLTLAYTETSNQIRVMTEDLLENKGEKK